MAFRHPAHALPRPEPLRIAPHDAPVPKPVATAQHDLSSEWILFGPRTEQLKSRHVPPFASRRSSELSDQASLKLPPSSVADEAALSDLLDDAEDLDSLDEGLYAFGEALTPSSYKRHDQSGGAVLPVHDGLGTFPLSATPDRHPSLSLTALAQVPIEESYKPPTQQTLSYSQETVAIEQGSINAEKRERIEQWRLAQSRALPTTAALGSHITRADRTRAPQAKSNSTSVELSQSLTGDDESLLQRLTRCLVENILGKDEELLGILFGETLLSETSTAASRSAAHAIQSDLHQAVQDNPGWSFFPEPGARATIPFDIRALLRQFQLESQEPNVSYVQPATDYAGMPLIGVEDYNNGREGNGTRSDLRKASLHDSSMRTTFRDTAPARHLSPPQHGVSQPASASTSPVWKQLPQLVTFLSHLLMSRPGPNRNPLRDSTPKVATQQTMAALRRFALIRDHHPLTMAAHRHHAAVNPASLRRGSCGQGITLRPTTSTLKRTGTSCASASTKRSKRYEGEDTGRGHYWEMTESLGAYSTSSIGIGLWGEV